MVEIISFFHILFILNFADGRNAFWSRTSEGGFPLQQNIIMIKPIFLVLTQPSLFSIFYIRVFFARYSKRKCQLATCLVFGEKETPPLLITTVCRLFTSSSLETGFKNHPLSLEEGDILLVHGTLSPWGGGGGNVVGALKNHRFYVATRAPRRWSCLQRRDSIQGWMGRPTARYQERRQCTFRIYSATAEM